MADLAICVCISKCPTGTIYLLLLPNRHSLRLINLRWSSTFLAQDKNNSQQFFSKSIQKDGDNSVELWKHLLSHLLLKLFLTMFFLPYIFSMLTNWLIWLASRFIRSHLKIYLIVCFSCKIQVLLKKRKILDEIF